MTQADIDSGIVNALIGLAPVRPAEFVLIHFQQTNSLRRASVPGILDHYRSFPFRVVCNGRYVAGFTRDRDYVAWAEGALASDLVLGSSSMTRTVA